MILLLVACWPGDAPLPAVQAQRAQGLCEDAAVPTRFALAAAAMSAPWAGCPHSEWTRGDRFFLHPDVAAALGDQSASGGRVGVDASTGEIDVRWPVDTDGTDLEVDIGGVLGVLSLQVEPTNSFTLQFLPMDGSDGLSARVGVAAVTLVGASENEACPISLEPPPPILPPGASVSERPDDVVELSVVGGGDASGVRVALGPASSDADTGGADGIHWPMREIEGVVVGELLPADAMLGLSRGDLSAEGIGPGDADPPTWPVEVSAEGWTEPCEVVLDP